jgi:hypothetical protein
MSAMGTLLMIWICVWVAGSIQRMGSVSAESLQSRRKISKTRTLYVKADEN